MRNSSIWSLAGRAVGSALSLWCLGMSLYLGGCGLHEQIPTVGPDLPVIQALPAPVEAGTANLSFELVLPTPDHTPPSSIRASLPDVRVTFQVVLLDVTSNRIASTTLAKTVGVDDNGTARTTFSGLPVRPVIGRIHIASGSLWGSADWRGATDLENGNNFLQVSPLGSREKPDVIAQVIESIVASSTRLASAPRKLITEIRKVVDLLSLTSTTVYDDALRGFLAALSGTGTSTGTGGATGNPYSLSQALSDNAQLTTIAFSGLAFITGNAGADTFIPPGKVADFFGFQYMRDVEIGGYGHSMQYLTRVANNVLSILTDAQRARLNELARTQASLYINFAYNRFPLMKAFRRSLEGDLPTGSTGLDLPTVSAYAGRLYRIDAELSYNRARVVGEIVSSFTGSQKVYLASMAFNDFLSWPPVAENPAWKTGMTNTEFVAVMTYASELFSWYKGNIDADVYFCPERHGTYFGGFFMKDYPATQDPTYIISTTITGDSGKAFLNILDTEQRALITSIIEEQRAALAEIGQLRQMIATELRKGMNGVSIDKAKVFSLISRYGELDGQISGLYAVRFSAVKRTLTASQTADLVKLRNLDIKPAGAFRYATAIAMPEIPSTDSLFGVGALPAEAGQATAPTGFGL